MKKRTWYAWLIIGLLLVPAHVHAQWLAPWFRGGKPAWQTIHRHAFTPKRVTHAKLSKPLNRRKTRLHVKTNISNWMQYRTAYTTTLSSGEKQVLARFPNNLLSTSGKLTYFYDKNILLLAAQQELFTGMSFSAKAFNRHQEILEVTRDEIENFAFEELSQHLYGWMSSHEAEILLHDNTQQPLSCVLARSDVKAFGSLSLAEQQQFANNKLAHAQYTLSTLLQTPDQHLSNDDFAQYYIFKLREVYFQTLVSALENATEPLSSIVIRIPVTLEIPFLPNPNEPLSDAQRLGKLYFYYHQDRLPVEQKVQLKAELEQQEYAYITYAVAEAFEIPYDKFLDIYTRGITAKDIFGEENGTFLHNLPKHELQRRIPGTLTKIAQAQAALREQTPTLQTYVEYFKLEYKKKWYQRHQ